MSHSDNVHAAESVGSNSSQNRNIKNHTTGNRKRETDSSSASSAYSMTNSECPVAKDSNYQKVALAIQMYRCVREGNQDTNEMRQQSGKYYWDKITSLANECSDQVFTRDNVLDMAAAIKAFHEQNSCECMGIYVGNKVVVREIPRQPTLHEREQWNNADGQRSKLAPYMSLGHPVREQRNTSVNRLESNMTFEGPSKRMRSDDPQPSVLPRWDDIYAPHPETSGHNMIKIMDHFELTSDMRAILAGKLLHNPGMFPVICNHLNGEQILKFLKSAIPEDMYENWLTEWLKRNT